MHTVCEPSTLANHPGRSTHLWSSSETNKEDHRGLYFGFSQSFNYVLYLGLLFTETLEYRFVRVGEVLSENMQAVI